MQHVPVHRWGMHSVGGDVRWWPDTLRVYGRRWERGTVRRTMPRRHSTIPLQRVGKTPDSDCGLKSCNLPRHYASPTAMAAPGVWVHLSTPPPPLPPLMKLIWYFSILTIMLICLTLTKKMHFKCNKNTVPKTKTQFFRPHIESSKMYAGLGCWKHIYIHVVTLCWFTFSVILNYHCVLWFTQSINALQVNEDLFFSYALWLVGWTKIIINHSFSSLFSSIIFRIMKTRFPQTECHFPRTVLSLP